jgi:uncharacterized protein YsxB (DUF464 family)
MIKIKVNKDSIEISGHANYDDYGKDIVCASVSSIVTTTVNGILELENTINFKSDDNKTVINVIKNTKTNKALISNMIDLLKELENQYPEHVKFIK